MNGLLSQPAGPYTWAELRALRGKLPPEHPWQVQLAELEHQAYAREKVAGEGPLEALRMAILVPGYQAAKGLGVLRGRTPASLGQLQAGYRGILEGLK